MSSGHAASVPVALLSSGHAVSGHAASGHVEHAVSRTIRAVTKLSEGLFEQQQYGQRRCQAAIQSEALVEQLLLPACLPQLHAVDCSAQHAGQHRVPQEHLEDRLRGRETAHQQLGQRPRSVGHEHRCRRYHLHRALLLALPRDLDCDVANEGVVDPADPEAHQREQQEVQSQRGVQEVQHCEHARHQQLHRGQHSELQREELDHLAHDHGPQHARAVEGDGDQGAVLREAHLGEEQGQPQQQSVVHRLVKRDQHRAEHRARPQQQRHLALPVLLGQLQHSADLAGDVGQEQAAQPAETDQHRADLEGDFPAVLQPDDRHLAQQEAADVAHVGRADPQSQQRSVLASSVGVKDTQDVGPDEGLGQTADELQGEHGPEAAPAQLLHEEGQQQGQQARGDQTEDHALAGGAHHDQGVEQHADGHGEDEGLVDDAQHFLLVVVDSVQHRLAEGVAGPQRVQRYLGEGRDPVEQHLPQQSGLGLLLSLPGYLLLCLGFHRIFNGYNRLGHELEMFGYRLIITLNSGSQLLATQGWAWLSIVYKVWFVQSFSRPSQVKATQATRAPTRTISSPRPNRQSDSEVSIKRARKVLEEATQVQCTASVKEGTAQKKNLLRAEMRQILRLIFQQTNSGETQPGSRQRYQFWPNSSRLRTIATARLSAPREQVVATPATQALALESIAVSAERESAASTRVAMTDSSPGTILGQLNSCYYFIQRQATDHYTAVLIVDGRHQSQILMPALRRDRTMDYSYYQRVTRPVLLLFVIYIQLRTSSRDARKLLLPIMRQVYSSSCEISSSVKNPLPSWSNFLNSLRATSSRSCTALVQTGTAIVGLALSLTPQMYLRARASQSASVIRPSPSKSRILPSWSTVDWLCSMPLALQASSWICWTEEFCRLPAALPPQSWKKCLPMALTRSRSQALPCWTWMVVVTTRLGSSWGMQLEPTEGTGLKLEEAMTELLNIPESAILLSIIQIITGLNQQPALSDTQCGVQINLMSRSKQMELNQAESLTFHYMRNCLWQSLLLHCEEAARKLQDNAFPFWKGYGYFMLQDVNEAINQLNALLSKRDISYAVIVALIVYHNKTHSVDKEALEGLRNREREERKQANDKAVSLAVQFLVRVDEERRAKDLLAEKESGGVQYRLAKAFYLYSQGDEAALQQYEQLYSGADSVSPNIEIFVGRVHSLIKFSAQQVQRKETDRGSMVETALEVVNRATVLYPGFVPLLLEKCELLIMLNEWEQFSESISTIMAQDSQNLLSLKFFVFELLVREGNADSAFFKINEFGELAEKLEGQNAQLVFQAMQLFVRICGRHPKILSVCEKLVSRCRGKDPLNADFQNELARIALIRGEYSSAYKMYQEGAALDESKLESVAGMIECKLRLKEVDDIQHQIEFLNEMAVSVGRTPEIAFLEALLAVTRSASPEEHQQSLKQVDAALKMQIALSKTLAPGFNFYVKLNPDFLFSIAELYFHSVDMGQMLGGAQNGGKDSQCGKGIRLLDSIIKQIPGFLPAHLLQAKAKLAIGSQSEAMSSISKVLALDSKNEEAYILQALILNKKGEHKSALLALQEAISKNFRIRENPLFMLIKGEIEFNMKDFDSAQATMEQAYGLPGVKDSSVKVVSNFKIVSFTERDRAAIFLLLARVYAAQKKGKESKAVMNDAISEFAGTSEEVSVMLANASIALEDGDIKKAISILKTVGPTSPYFVEGKKMLAEVYLTNMKNRRQFAKCYSDIIDSKPSLENYRLLGEAMLRINEPEEAALAFEKAHELNTENESIIRALGHAYSLSHEYQRAIEFYQKKLTDNKDRVDLKIDLARLYMMLKRFRDARDRLPVEVIMNSETTKSLKNLKLAVQGFVLLHQIELKQQGPLDLTPNDQARKLIKSACKLQKEVIDAAKAEGGDVTKEKEYLGTLFIKVAEYTEKYEKNNEDSLTLLADANKQFPENVHILELLAGIYFRTGDYDKCQSRLEVITKLDPKNEVASYLMAELLLKGSSNNYQKALQQYQRILNDKPDSYSVLARLIDFFRRNNDMRSASEYLARAESRASNHNDAGLCFCRGLISKYNRAPKAALAQFSKAKKSGQWAEASLVHLIDIYLNPDQDLMYSAGEESLRTVDPDNINVCDTFLKEMSLRASNYRFRAVEGLVALISNRLQPEEVARRMVQILKNRPDYLPALLTLTLAKLQGKKTTEAKSFLKMVANNAYDFEFGEELEQLWLLTADSFIAIQKYDNAEDILRKILKENKSCGKAEELLGLIKEQEQAFIDAANHYHRAYELTQNKSASIGFRLAFNYLKAKEYIPCIEICKKILEQFPKFPKIEKEILEKARFALK